MFFRRKSPENTNKNSEQAPDSSSSNAEYPAFNPEAAKRRVAEYKVTHPNAIEDIKKAETMAYAGNWHRTSAMKSEQFAEDFLKFAKDAQSNSEARVFANLASEYREEASRANNVANFVEEEAGRQYDLDQNPNQAMKEAIIDFQNNEDEYLASSKQDEGDFNKNDKSSTPRRSRFKPFGKSLRESKNDTDSSSNRPQA